LDGSVQIFGAFVADIVVGAKDMSLVVIVLFFWGVRQ
jgi:hypothetical protein